MNSLSREFMKSEMKSSTQEEGATIAPTWSDPGSLLVMNLTEYAQEVEEKKT